MGLGLNVLKAASRCLRGKQQNQLLFAAALEQKPTFTRGSACVSGPCRPRQPDRPGQINQFEPRVCNKPRELSWRGLASSCRACPDLTAALRAALASEQRQAAEKGERLHRTLTENAADRAALGMGHCQQVSIPSPAAAARHCLRPVPRGIKSGLCVTGSEHAEGSGKAERTTHWQGPRGNCQTPKAMTVCSLRSSSLPQVWICFHFKPVLHSGLNWGLDVFYVAYATHCVSSGMTVPATSSLQLKSDCRFPETRAKPARFFLSTIFPMTGQITRQLLGPFPASWQHQLLHTGWTGFPHFLWSLERLYESQSYAKGTGSLCNPAGCCHHPGQGAMVCENDKAGGGGNSVQKEPQQRGEL